MYIIGMDKYIKRAWVGGIGADEAFILMALFSKAKLLFSKFMDVRKFFSILLVAALLGCNEAGSLGRPETKGGPVLHPLGNVPPLDGFVADEETALKALRDSSEKLLREIAELKIDMSLIDDRCLNGNVKHCRHGHLEH
jgi:hypothetical protein